MKYRIKLTQLATIILIILAKPYLWQLFVLGLLIALLGETTRIWASGYLKKDKALATDGPYKLVRNPLYVGSFLMSMGFAVICINPYYPYRTVALFLIMLLGFKFVYSLQVKAEEKHLENLFGSDFINYKKTTNKYLPNLKETASAVKESNFSFSQMKKNKEFTTIFGFLTVTAVLAVKLYFKI